jgi:hypothetical protein
MCRLLMLSFLHPRKDHLDLFHFTANERSLAEHMGSTFHRRGYRKVKLRSCNGKTITTVKKW